MSDDRFSDYIDRERERLSRERQEISNQRRGLHNRLAAIDREFQALEAYQAAKTGRPSGRRTQMQRRAARFPARGTSQSCSPRKWPVPRRNPGTDGPEG